MSVNFHLHDNCEIYYLVSGKVKYLVEKTIYDIGERDIFITNQSEIHKPNIEPSTLYERITLTFDPDFFTQFSTPDFDLVGCFFNRENGTGNKITLSEGELAKTLSIFAQIEAVSAEAPKFTSIKLTSLMLDLLILLNTASKRNTAGSQKNMLSGIVVEIMDYIDKNLDADLSLDRLVERFYISKSYLCKIFKEETSSTLHQYIMKKRISRAKQLLTSGASVTEAISRSGFEDFSNFIKTFKKQTGLTPSEYRRQFIH